MCVCVRARVCVRACAFADLARWRTSVNEVLFSLVLFANPESESVQQPERVGLEILVNLGWRGVQLKFFCESQRGDPIIRLIDPQ